MGTMTIRQVDDDLKEGVREKSAWEAIREAFGPDWEGVEFESPPRGPDRRAPDFND